MAKSREAVGEISCPLCQRDAELHAFDQKEKLNPDAAEGGRPSYPKKHFVICPPVKGYRGCGTILANGNGAQERLMELGTVFGAAGKAKIRAPAPDSAPPMPAAAPAAPIPPAPAPAAKKNPFQLW